MHPVSRIIWQARIECAQLSMSFLACPAAHAATTLSAKVLLYFRWEHRGGRVFSPHLDSLINNLILNWQMSFFLRWELEMLRLASEWVRKVPTKDPQSLKVFPCCPLSGAGFPEGTRNAWGSSRLHPQVLVPGWGSQEAKVAGVLINTRVFTRPATRDGEASV